MFQISGQYSARQFVEFCFRSEFQFDVIYDYSGTKERISVAFRKGNWILSLGDTRIEVSDSADIWETTDELMSGYLKTFLRAQREANNEDPCRGVPARAICDWIEMIFGKMDREDATVEVWVVQPHRDGWIDRNGNRV